MNKFERFNENPAMTLQDIKETKRYGRTDGQRENSIPPTNKVCGGYNKVNPDQISTSGVIRSRFTLFTQANLSKQLREIWNHLNLLRGCQTFNDVKYFSLLKMQVNYLIISFNMKFSFMFIGPA